MNVKKLLALLCACALIFALAIPVFASTVVDNPATDRFEGTDTENDPDLTVSVSVLKGADKLFVNPYGLPYTIKNGTTKDTDGKTDLTIVEGTTTDGWFSTTSVLKNESTTALEVHVSMVTEENGHVKVVADEADAQDGMFNYLYGNFEITSATFANNTITPSWEDDDTEQVAIPAAGAPAALPEYTKFDLDAAESKAGVGGAMSWTYTFAAFRLRGSAVLISNDDATAGEVGVWDKGDLADVTVAFSFKPQGTTEP